MTGAASGIGRAVAVTLANAGATVAAVDRNADGVKATADQIAGSAHATDLTDPGAVLALRDAVIEAHGVPDIVVNAAGWDRIEPFMDNDDELWQTLTTINLLGPVRLSHALLGPIIEAGNGAKIVNIASDAGRVGSTGETRLRRRQGRRHRVHQVARARDGPPSDQRQLRLPRTD